MKRHASAWGRAGYAFAAAIVMLVSVFPLAVAISSSLKTGDQLFDPSLWPTAASAVNYRKLFAEHPFGHNLLSSLVVASAVTAISLSVSLLAAWSLGRVDFRGRRTLLLAILASSMFPQVAVLSGMFELIRVLGLYDTPGALILADLLLTLPFTVWVLVTFMRQLPRELEEAAVLDGAGPLAIVFRVFLPLLWPALVATGLLAFIAAWNEFLFALTFTLSPDVRTVPVAIALISASSAFELPWGGIMAASVIVTLPLIGLVLLLQRHVVAGLTQGAVKG